MSRTKADSTGTAVRRASSGDLDTIETLWNEYAAEITAYRATPWTWSWEDVGPRLEQGAAFLAELEGEPIGFLIASRSRADIGHIDDVYVRPAHRRQGVATALLRQLAAAFRERGVEHVALDVDIANEAARTLYDRLGFRAYATRLAAPVGSLDRPPMP